MVVLAHSIVQLFFLLSYISQLRGLGSLLHVYAIAQLPNSGSDEWHVALATNLKEEGKLIEAGFEFVRYSEKDEVAIYRKRK